jgi:hypothetical protein
VVVRPLGRPGGTYITRPAQHQRTTPGYPGAVRNDRDDQVTPDLPPPVEAPELWRTSEKGEGEQPPDPEHGPGDDSGTGEPPD